MKSLYLIIDLATLFFPLVLSFDKKVAYFKLWKRVFLSSLIIAIPFLIWDSLFTAVGVWGFNKDYLCGIYLGNLPLEEVLFFFIVPFACVFIYACVKVYFEKTDFIKLNLLFYVLLAGYLGFVAVYGYCCAYSQWVSVSTVLTLLVIFLMRKRLHFFPMAFLITLIPFLLVNGILTGAMTEEPVVWYHTPEHLPWRIFTIPMEDVLYGFTLIGLNVAVFERISKKLES